MAPTAGLLSVNRKHVDTALASLFASSAGPVVKAPKSRPVALDVNDTNGADSLIAKRSEISLNQHENPGSPVEAVWKGPKDNGRRKRKRDIDEHDDLEEKFFKNLAEEVDDDSNKGLSTGGSVDSMEDSDNSNSDEDGDSEDSSIADTSIDEVDNVKEISSEDDEIPLHESLDPSKSVTEPASRTVFLGNISTAAVTSKSAKRILMTHLSSFLSDIPTTTDSITHELVSIRFRSTPYESTLPNKRAAFAKGAVMDATSASTNAYAVYSSAAAVRAACSRLNGTVVLGRHLRVDSVAHPSPQDSKRCVFVGNLGFTAVEPDDQPDDPDTPDDKKKSQKKKKLPPQDPEEGLWTHFSTCGTVESVRVVRDSQTRIGKGFAYVQFNDVNAVEKALLLNDQKFPPMLPRKLRVVRARKTKKKDMRDDGGKRSIVIKGSTEAERSLRGRANKLLGKGGAKQLSQALKQGQIREKRRKIDGDSDQNAGKMVFEGQRASVKDGNKGLRFGKKKGKSSNRSVRRAEAWRKGKL